MLSVASAPTWSVSDKEWSTSFKADTLSLAASHLAPTSLFPTASYKVGASARLLTVVTPASFVVASKYLFNALAEISLPSLS